MILPIYIYGNSVLREEAQDITKDYPEISSFIEDMFETLASSDGIGLAAPQVGRNVRVIVIDLDALSEEMPEYKGFKCAYINPHILEYDDNAPKKSMEEGCLSLPGIHENVLRPTRIHVTYLDDKFTEHDEWVGGYLARVMQHEIDHLEGKMFIDRLSPMRKQMIRGKLKSLRQGRYRCSYRTKPAKK